MKTVRWGVEIRGGEKKGEAGEELKGKEREKEWRKEQGGLRNTIPL